MKHQHIDNLTKIVSQLKHVPQTLWNLVPSRVLFYWLFSTLIAFSRDTLTNTRWLLNGVCKTSSGVWHEVLKMTEIKQVLLMQRLLHLHSIQNRKAGKACVARLTFDQFEQEVDKVCFLGFVMEAIARNQTLFPADVVQRVEFAIIEGCLSLIVFFLFRRNPWNVNYTLSDSKWGVD